MTGFNVPAATYRLQLHHGFPFRAAQALVPYLHDLGISDLYASPLLQSPTSQPAWLFRDQSLGDQSGTRIQARLQGAD